MAAKVREPEEVILDLRQQVAELSEEIKKKEKAEKLRLEAGEATKAMAILRDSLLENGFTEEQAFEIIKIQCEASLRR